jgi:transposase-like protein
MTELYNLLIPIIGALIILLLGIIGIFLKRLLDKFDEMSKIIEDILISMASATSNHNNFTTNCSVTHKAISNVLNEHSERIRSIEIDVNTIKTLIK